MSSHNLPIEILRYKKINRDERICSICHLKEMGDETHYLKRCTNSKLISIRNNFLDNIKTLTQFSNFNDNNIIDYCLSMKDTNIQTQTAKYVKELLKKYKQETNVPPLHIICTQYIDKIENQNKNTQNNTIL